MATQKHTGRIILVVLLTLVTAACGGSGDSPAAPTPPPIANYAGTWTGTYTITGCTQSGGIALVNVCRTLGQVLPFQLSLTQGGSSASGSFTLGTISFPSTGGTVGSDGSLTLNGSTTSDGITIIVTWALRMAGSSMMGTVTQVWTSNTLSGQATLVGTIGTATR